MEVMFTSLANKLGHHLVTAYVWVRISGDVATVGEANARPAAGDGGIDILFII